MDKNDLAPFYFHQGTSHSAHLYLGGRKEGDGYVFRVWAPNADYVSVVGDFNSWDTMALPMAKITEKGIWEAYSPLPHEGDLYKFFIKNHGKELYKGDPFAYYFENPPKTASRLFDISGYDWRDEGWLRYRKERFTREKVVREPLNVYEVHLSSFLKSASDYRTLAEELSSYVKAMGYTHIELMPITEHPYEGSWGYQVTGFFAPTSRFGNPHDFMYFVDKMHEAGIGVILDWVPAHFPKDAHGLFEFDGAPLFEYQGKDRMEHRGWGTRCFDVGREEVQSFLISSAFHWIENYHVDGLRVDAVASMLYLDYDRKPDEWIPNVYGENKSLEALAFFRKLNSALSEYHPDVMTIAEESTAWSNVTTFQNGGLGFTFKWNMGWMNDTLAYAEEDPLFRKYHHNRINFSLTYAFSERYVLPISHDEVVHGKKSFLDKMSGDYDLKFASARVFFAYMMTHPGKKLTFMGCEIGQFREWDWEGEIEWFLLDYEAHRRLQSYVRDLNLFYLENPPLFEKDLDWSGFSWIDADDADNSIFTFCRFDDSGSALAVALNFTPVRRDNFYLSVPEKGVWREAFNSDLEKYGGGNIKNPETESVEYNFKGWREAIKITLPPMSALIFKKE